MSRDTRVTSFSIIKSLYEEVQAASKREQVSQATILNRALSQYFSTKIARSSWDTEDADDWYDEKKFYVHSQDSHGHSHYARIWIPKNVAGLIGRVVNSGQVSEYRSTQDFYRDAMLHRAHRVAQWIDDEELEAEAGVLAMASEEESIERAKKDAEDLIEKIRVNLQAAWENREYEWMEDHIAKRFDQASMLPETHRQAYVDMLKEYLARLGDERVGKVRDIGRKRRERAEAAN